MDGTGTLKQLGYTVALTPMNPTGLFHVRSDLAEAPHLLGWRAVLRREGVVARSTGQGRGLGAAPMRHAGHEPAPGGSRPSRGSRSPWGHADGPGRMAPRQGPRRARQPHAGAAAGPSARIEPG